MMKKWMTKGEFLDWKKKWFDKVPGCKDFACCHELMTCAVKPLCGFSIYESYINQEIPLECLEVSCKDCFLIHECKKTKSK